MTFAAGLVIGLMAGFILTIGFALLCGDDDDWGGA